MIGIGTPERSPGDPGPIEQWRAFDGPAWRAARARRLVETGRRPRRLDDHWTYLAWRYLRHRGRQADSRLPADLEAVQRASLIREENLLPRWHLEARLL